MDFEEFIVPAVIVMFSGVLISAIFGYVGSQPVPVVVATTTQQVASSTPTSQVGSDDWYVVGKKTDHSYCDMNPSQYPEAYKACMNDENSKCPDPKEYPNAYNACMGAEESNK